MGKLNRNIKDKLSKRKHNRDVPYFGKYENKHSISEQKVEEKVPENEE
jgi:hypothetical protein